jgi:hypothetical protein
MPRIGRTVTVAIWPVARFFRDLPRVAFHRKSMMQALEASLKRKRRYRRPYPRLAPVTIKYAQVLFPDHKFEAETDSRQAPIRPREQSLKAKYESQSYKPKAKSQKLKAKSQKLKAKS